MSCANRGSNVFGQLHAHAPMSSASKRKQDGGSYPEIANHVADRGSYDTIFLGYPIR